MSEQEELREYDVDAEGNTKDVLIDQPQTITEEEASIQPLVSPNDYEQREMDIVKSDNAPTTVDERKSSKKKRTKSKTFGNVIVKGPGEPMPDFNPMINENENRVDLLDQSMMMKKQMHYNHQKKIDPLMAESGKKIRRQSTYLEQEAKFTDFNSDRSASQNMKSFIDNFGIRFELPSLDVQDAKFYPSNCIYSLQLAKYIFPVHRSQKISTHYMDGITEISYFDQIFEQYRDKLVLRMLIRSHTSMKQVDEMKFDTNKALIEFHPDGDYFAIYVQESQTIKICQVVKEEIKDLISKLKAYEDISDESQYDVVYHGETNNPFKDIGFIEKITFDINKRFLIGYGNNKIFMMNLKNPAQNIIYQNNDRIYEKICDINFESSSNTSYKCILSCLRKGIKQVCTFDLIEDIKVRDQEKTIYHKRKLMSMATINFQADIADNFQVRLSMDAKQVILANGPENCVLDIYEDGQYKQTKLKQLKTKQIKHVQCDRKEGGFVMLASQGYDKYLSVEHTLRDEFSVRFNKSIEPGIIKIFDFNLQLAPNASNDDPNVQKKEIRILSNKDTEFMLDKCSYEDVREDPISTLPEINPRMQRYNYVQKNEVYNNYIFSPLRAFSMCWPFIAFSGLGNYILLINAYESTKIRRIQVAEPHKSITICQTYITETNDLFVCIQDDEHYRLFTMDLDYAIEHEFDDRSSIGDIEPYTFRQILSYHDSVVNLETMTQMHVRGSSKKSTLDLNQSLQVFMVHGQNIYKWIQLKDTQEITHVCKTTSRLMPYNDSIFYFSEIDKDPITKQNTKQDINVIQVLFSTHDLSTVYSEKSQTEKVKTFNLDQTSNKLIILSKTSSSREATLKTFFMFKIFDLNSKKIIYESDLNFPELIGRLKSGLYAFVNGHIYYNNNVIKIRYDLIDENPTVQLLEHQIFDYYFNCFKLEQNERVCADTPLDSIRGHRFAYIIQDVDQMQAKKLFILPYLHERRIYMNQKNTSSEYFYTTIETEVGDVERYNTKLMTSVKRKSTIINKIKTVEGVNQFPINNSMLQKLGMSMHLSLMSQIDALENLSFTSVICMDLTKSVYEVYTQNALLINTVDFSHLVQEFGHPVATSNNGQVWVFKKSLEQLEDMQINGSSNEELMKEFMTVSIMKVSIFKFQFMKKLNLTKCISEYYKSHDNGGKQGKDGFYAQNHWLRKSQIFGKELHSMIDFAFVINDTMDFLARIRNMEDFDPQRFYIYGEPTKNNVIFFYESGKNAPITRQSINSSFQRIAQLTNGQLQGLFLSKNLRDSDFTMNCTNIIFWDRKTIKTLNITKKSFCEDNFEKVKFEIDPNDHGSYIEEVRTGSDPNHILFVVHQDTDKGNILSWDLVSNTENDAFDIEDDYIIIWDQNGAPFIVTEKKIYFVNQRCAITAYDYKGLMQDFGKNPLQKLKGHRMDSKNHNWIMLDQFLSLPFSYMSFVIKDKIEQNDPLQEGNKFDIQPWNYIFNKSTCFIEGKFVVENYRQLDYVLKELAQIDNSHIEILHYTQEINLPDGSIANNSALHKSERAGNQRSIDIILNFMSQINYNASRSFAEILPDLIDMHCFPDYFKCLPVQTQQMAKKQILKIQSPLNDRIVAMTHSSSVYVDQQFFVKDMNETPENQSYPVNVVGFRIGWIIKQPEGKKFLFAILNQNNLDLYKIETLQMIVEFLFQKIKIIIFSVFAPLYIASHITYENLLQEQDHFYRTIWELREGGTVFCSSMGQDEKKSLDIWAIFNFIAMTIQMAQIIVQIYSSRSAYFMRMYSYLDLIYIVQNFVTYISIYIHFAHDMEEEEFIYKVKQQRLIGCIGTITLYCKASYFLSLVDQIAPLIDIIVKIFYDIKWFMVVLLIYLVMLANCFRIMSATQLDFYPTDDAIVQAKIEAYGEKWASYWYVANFIIGNTDTSTFSQGDKQTELVLKGIFCTASLVIILHFLNMLIAIMGNTFSERTEVGAQIMVRDHLRFVMDNWMLLKVAFKDRESINYIIAALSANENSDENDLISKLETQHSETKELHREIQNQFKQNFILTRDLQYNVQDILRRQQNQGREQK